MVGDLSDIEFTSKQGTTSRLPKDASYEGLSEEERRELALEE